jgi:hypothetical protein
MIAILIAASLCGADHQLEKTLRDPGAAKALAPAPAPSTITQLGKLPKTSRRRAYTVEGTIQVIKTEADRDRHVVVSDGQSQMVVEVPDPACATGSAAIAAMKRARRKVAGLKVGDHVKVVGMLFFDKLHGQTGSAPNGAELHPVFDFTTLP